MKKYAFLRNYSKKMQKNLLNSKKSSTFAAVFRVYTTREHKITSINRLAGQ